MRPQSIDDTPESRDESALRLLARHDQRRRAGLPTVSVLLAEPSAANAAWRKWIRRDRPAVESTASAPRDLVVAVIDAIRRSTDLALLALQYLTRSARIGAGSDDPAIDIRTPHDLDTLVQAALDAGAPENMARAALEFCRTVDAHRTTRDVVERIDGVLGSAAGLQWFKVLNAVAALLPSELWPAIFLTSPSTADASSWHREASVSIEQLTQTVPQWPVVVAIAPEAFDRFCREAPASRAKSLLQSGVIPLSISAAASGGAERASSQPATIRALKAVQTSARLLEALEAAQALQPRQDEEARSAAERFLFELLESHPASKGQFVLNADPGFDFGPRAAEVDLLALGLRLAVEVDGYYHFTDPVAYRRDRRKDWELQRHGFRVVRVLADDVVTRMDEVLDFILGSIEHCQRCPMGKDVEP
jgi:hypothetical protein